MREDSRGWWTKLVADFESNDLTQREFAIEGGISLRIRHVNTARAETRATGANGSYERTNMSFSASSNPSGGRRARDGRRLTAPRRDSGWS